MDENLELRKMLWLRHGCNIAILYGDDGEMQCPQHIIDFKRDSPELIESKLQARPCFETKPTSSPSNEPGWYWFYDAEIQEWEVIQVRFTENYIKNEVELVADTYHAVYVEDIKCELVDEMKGQWSGPIKEPTR